MYMHMHIKKNVSTSCIYVYMYICIYVYMYICIYVYMCMCFVFIECSQDLQPSKKPPTRRWASQPPAPTLWHGQAVPK